MTDRPRIMIDLDGCVYKWEETARYLLKAHRGLDIGVSEDWNYIQQRISEDDWKWLWSEGVRLGVFRHGNLYRGAADALSQLSDIGTLVACTSRPDAALEDTLAFLAYQRFPFSEVHVLSAGQPKSEVAHCDVYLDDGPHNIEDLARNIFGATVCVMDRPWNRQVQTEKHVHRVTGWPEFVALVKYLPALGVAL